MGHVISSFWKNGRNRSWNVHSNGLQWSRNWIGNKWLLWLKTLFRVILCQIFHWGDCSEMLLNQLVAQGEQCVSICCLFAPLCKQAWAALVTGHFNVATGRSHLLSSCHEPVSVGHVTSVNCLRQRALTSQQKFVHTNNDGSLDYWIDLVLHTIVHACQSLSPLVTKNL